MHIKHIQCTKTTKQKYLKYYGSFYIHMKQKDYNEVLDSHNWIFSGEPRLFSPIIDNFDNYFRTIVINRAKIHAMVLLWHFKERERERERASNYIPYIIR